MKILYLINVLLIVFVSQLSAQFLRISENHRYLIKDTGEPFFYLADTAWELFHHLDRNEADNYLRNRAGKGFNVIQAVLLSEINGLTVPNKEGNLPLINMDPAKPNEKYFELVDYIVERAQQYGIYVVLLPTWGAHVEDKPHPLFENMHIFTIENSELYGRFLGKRYGDKWNVLWFLGGDRTPENTMNIWNAMAKGLKNGGARQLMSYHINGGESTSTWLQDAEWLDFNQLQVGHARPSGNDYEMVANEYNTMPVKPVLNAETTYEGIVWGFSEANPRFTDYDVRKAAWWSVFAGAFGFTYGHNSLWQMWSPELAPIVWANIPWMEALEAPGASQMRFLKNLITSRPFLTRFPDQTLLLEGVTNITSDFMCITRDRIDDKNNASYIMVYMPVFHGFKIDTHLIPGKELRTWWYDPRNGYAIPLGVYKNTGSYSPGWNERIRKSMGSPDWVLVIDDASMNYPAPGTCCK